jgi:hypothetical protein
LQFSTSADPFIRGLDYLYGARTLALDAEMIDLVYDLDRRMPICIWIGQQIDAINATLRTYLQACHDCFHSAEQPAVQIFAVPIASRFGIDGCCNLKTAPISILVDVGRVMPQDWLALVVHEYAHARTGFPGHHQAFAQTLGHLCLGLGIAPPPLLPLTDQSLTAQLENLLGVYPPYRSTLDPLAFWQGQDDKEKNR